MGFGQRLRRMFGTDGTEADGDPDSLQEAGVVLLGNGPMAVERLRAGGVPAVGVESIDPVTGANSLMRIMVRRTDLAAARQQLAESSADGATGEEALDRLVDTDDESVDEQAEEASQQAMSELFVVADRLVSAPSDPGLLDEADRLRAAVASGPPPFGIDHTAWTRMTGLASAVVAADEEDGENEVREAATALRDFLRLYV